MSRPRPLRCTARPARVSPHLLVGVVLAVAIASCAPSGEVGEAGAPEGDGAVAEAAAHLGAARRGTIDFSFLASTPESSQVGFRIEGSYSLDSPGRYPVLDFTYSRSPASLGQVQLRSRGDAIFAGTGGALTPVPEDRLGVLRFGEGAGIVSDFGFDDWIKDPRERADGDTIVTTGSVDVTGFLSDIVQIAAPVSGAPDLRGSREAAEQLQRQVKSSDVRVVTDAESNALRELDVVVEFAPEATEEVRTALGSFGGVRLEVGLAFAPLDEVPHVDVPG